MLRAGTSLVTTLFAPMTAWSPIVTPGMITTFWPIQHPVPIDTGAIFSMRWYLYGTSAVA